MYGYSNGRYEAEPIQCFQQAKQRYEEVKPIRGRSGDIRPLGKRRRDWERIVKISDGAYAIRFYSTDVVTYYEDGVIELRTGGWPSVSTSEMINLHSPLSSTKREGRVWVWHSDDRKYIVPVDRDRCLRMIRVGGVYQPDRLQVYKQKVTDRTGIKELREKIAPFIKFTKTMLALSGGWIYTDSIEELGGKKLVRGWSTGCYHFPEHFNQYEASLLDLVGGRYEKNPEHSKAFMDLVSKHDEDQWMRVMYVVLFKHVDAEEKSFAFELDLNDHEHSTTRTDCKFFNYRFDPARYMNYINKVLRLHPDAQTTRNVTPSSEFRSNII